MTRKLIIILANADPSNGENLDVPIFQACVAAGMSYSVEVFCTGAAVKLLKPGIAGRLRAKACGTKSVYDFIKEAHAAGVKFFCCPPGLDRFDMHNPEDFIPECSGVVGAAHLIEEIMSDNARVLTY